MRSHSYRRDAEEGSFAEMDARQLNKMGGVVLDASITVHKELGPGLLESAYQFALAREFELRGLRFQAQMPLGLTYKGAFLDKGYILDFLVEDEIVIEIKSVETLHPVYEAQLLTYLKLSNRRLGYLINFNAPLLKEGFKRFVNKL